MFTPLTDISFVNDCLLQPIIIIIIIIENDIYGAVIMAKPLREFTRFIWWMQTQRRGGRQPSDQANRLGLWVRQKEMTATVRIHHRHLLLLSPRADIHFTVPWRVEGWVDLAHVTLQSPTASIGWHHGFFSGHSSTVVGPLMECCRVDDVSPECTVTEWIPMLTDCTSELIPLSHVERGRPQCLLQRLGGRSDASITRCFKSARATWRPEKQSRLSWIR